MATPNPYEGVRRIVHISTGVGKGCEHCGERVGLEHFEKSVNHYIDKHGYKPTPCGTGVWRREVVMAEDHPERGQKPEDAVANPRLFISYSWTSEEHESWVVSLAIALRDAGIDVILDKWDLKEGHDAYRFMEQMVSNPEIKKVAMICDRKYVEKANNRVGGVGAEAQIISPEIYESQDQSKFVAIIAERDEHGNLYVPVYYRSRIYIDLSDESLYASNFEQLVRWVYDKPLYVKPPLGKAPSFITEPDQSPLVPGIYPKRALDSIRSQRPSRAGAVAEYFGRLASGLEGLQVPEAGEIDDQVVESINHSLSYRNEAIEIFLSLAQYGPSSDEVRALHGFFEQLLPQLKTGRRSVGAVTEVLRFVVHELFLYCIASLLNHERFGSVAHLLREPYYIENSTDGPGRIVSFDEFRVYMNSLERRNERLNLRRLSLRADMLKNRSSGSGLAFHDLLQADFTLYIRDCLDSLRENRHQGWWPETLIWSNGNDPFRIFAKAQSKNYFDSLRVLFDVDQKTDFDVIFQAFRDRRLQLPRWQFETFDPATLMGYERMATRP